MNCLNRTMIAAGLVVAMASAAPAAIISINYDTEGDLVDNFAFNKSTENTSDTQYDRQDGIGVGGSGGVDLQGDGAVATYDQQSFDLTAEGSSLTLSHEILYDADSNDDAFVINRVGFLGDTGLGFGASNRLVADLANLNSGTGFHFWIDGSIKTGAQVTLTDDTWYRLIATFTATGANNVEISAELFDLGADGTATPTSLGTDSYSASTSLRTDSEVYAGWKIAGGPTGSGSIVADNFQVIPEPTFVALFALGGAGLLVGRRRHC